MLHHFAKHIYPPTYVAYLFTMGSQIDTKHKASYLKLSQLVLSPFAA